MNLVIDAEGEAVIRILDLFKKYFVAAYPMIKLLGETGMKMGSEIQEVIDDYKDPEEDKSVNLTIVNIAQTEHDSKLDISEQKTTKSSKKKKHICPICLRSAMIDPKKGNITCKICGQDMLRVE